MVLTRDEAIPRLRNIVVALVTRTIRGIDTEVELGPADGMPVQRLWALRSSARSADFRAWQDSIHVAGTCQKESRLLRFALRVP